MTLDTLHFVVGLLGLAFAGVWGTAYLLLVRRDRGPGDIGGALGLLSLLAAQAIPAAGLLLRRRRLRRRWEAAWAAFSSVSLAASFAALPILLSLRFR